MIEVCDKDGGYRLRVALAGFEPKEIDVTAIAASLKNGMLEITATKAEAKSESPEKIHVFVSS